MVIQENIINPLKEWQESVVFEPRSHPLPPLSSNTHTSEALYRASYYRQIISRRLVPPLSYYSGIVVIPWEGQPAWISYLLPQLPVTEVLFHVGAYLIRPGLHSPDTLLIWWKFLSRHIKPRILGPQVPLPWLTFKSEVHVVGRGTKLRKPVIANLPNVSSWREGVIPANVLPRGLILFGSKNGGLHA